jgi:hypothetical protein
MLSYLLDEHLSPEIAVQVRAKRPDIPVQTVQTWREGDLRGKDDEAVLLAAREEALTLLTYDQHTIMELLVRFAEAGIDHAGVIFVDDRAIRMNDYGGLVRAILVHWEARHTQEWGNRVDFLRPNPSSF